MRNGIGSRLLVLAARVDELKGKFLLASEANDLLVDRNTGGLVLDQDSIAFLLARALDDLFDAIGEAEALLPEVHQHDLGVAVEIGPDAEDDHRGEVVLLLGSEGGIDDS